MGKMEKILKLGMSVALAMVISTSIASAQEQADEATQSGDQTAVTQDGQEGAVEGDSAQPAVRKKRRTLDEVVVTAQKREQSLQEVPMSVTALSGEAIKQSEISDFNDLSRYTPNVKVAAGGILNRVYIRGLGSDYNEGFEQSVGLFIDDVYYGKAHYLVSALIDIERVEVLRGPQGSLFGKNTVAGAIAIHTGMPGYEFGADINASLDEEGSKEFSGFVNVPILDDRLAVRLTGAYIDRYGNLTNTFDGSRDGDVEYRVFRGKVRFDVTDDLFLTASYLKNDAIIPNGTRSQYSVGHDFWMPIIQAFDPKAEADISDGQTTLDDPARTEQLSDDLMLHASWDIKDHNLSLALGYSEYTRQGHLDADLGPVPMIGLDADEAYNQLSADLKLTSGLGKLEYVAGLYYFQSTLDFENHLNILPTATFLANPTLFGAQPLSILSGLGAGDILGTITGAILGDQIALESQISNYHQDNKTYAAYGQLTWNVFDELTLTAGARIAEDEKDIVFKNDLELANGNIQNQGLILVGLLEAEEFLAIRSQTSRDVSLKLSGLWRATDWANVYLSYAEGFKAGGFNASAANDNNLEFFPESAVTYEAGIKTQLWDNSLRINLGVFRTEFDDLQVSVFNGVQTIVRNAATATSQGLEFEGTAVFDWGTSVMFALALLDAKYGEYVEGPCTTTLEGKADPNAPDNCDLSGEKLARTPDYQASVVVSHVQSLGNLPFDLLIGGDVLAHGDVNLQSDLDPLDFQEAYILTNARLGFQAKDLSWSFTAAVRNLTDEVVKTSSADVPLFFGMHYASIEQRRTFSLKFRAQF